VRVTLICEILTEQSNEDTENAVSRKANSSIKLCFF